MEKILIALDYNSSAEKVAEMGFTVAKAMNAKIILAHVITEPAYYEMTYTTVMGYESGFIPDLNADVEEIKKEALRFLTAIVSNLGDTSIKTIVLDGEVEDAILKYSEKEKIDLIIMGSHRHKGIDRFLLPDVAAHVLKHSKIPLLTIPTNE